jgi:hypothetical protein
MAFSGGKWHFWGGREKLHYLTCFYINQPQILDRYRREIADSNGVFPFSLRLASLEKNPGKKTAKFKRAREK